MRAIVIAFVSLLAGCVGNPNTASMDPGAGHPGAFTLPLENGDVARAQAQASETCRAQRRTARLLARHRDRADFRCD